MNPLTTSSEDEAWISRHFSESFHFCSQVFVIAFVYCFVLVLILESCFVCVQESSIDSFYTYCIAAYVWLRDFRPLSRWVSRRIKALENGYIPLTKKAQCNAKFWKNVEWTLPSLKLSLSFFLYDLPSRFIFGLWTSYS